MTTLLNHRYQIIQVLGAGGFGTTFLAEDTQMPSRRKCVIKQLKPIASNLEIYRLVQERFEREAAILEELGDANDQIPRLYAYFIEEEQFFLVQEWVQGQTLSQVQVEKPLEPHQVKAILASLLSVLGYVHDRRIVHRDIKPDNIMLRQRDSKPVLIDFGAVKEAMGTVVTTEGGMGSSIVIGTPGFMPSEQAAGRPLYSSDLYSLSLTMIYLLTGRFPQDLDLDPRTGDIRWQDYAPPNLESNLAAVLDKAIQSHPRDRFATAGEMLSALESEAATPQMQPASTQLATGDAVAAIPPPTLFSNPEVPATQIDAPEGNLSPLTKQNPIPDEIHGWNWGAFLLPGFWFLGSQVWIGALAWTGSFTAGIGWLVAAVLLGAKGNEWAWKSRSWRSLAAFKAHQRTWAIAGFGVYGAFVLMIALILIFAPMPEEDLLPDASPSPSSQPRPSKP